jgi:hypothetical protein
MGMSVCRGRLEVSTVFLLALESYSCLPGVRFGSRALWAMGWIVPGMILDMLLLDVFTW